METLSIRIDQGSKEKFESIFQKSEAVTKAEFLSMLLKRYEATKEVIPAAPVIQPEPKIIEKNVEVERKLRENEILVKLNKVQLFTLTETILFDKFVERTNGFINLVDEGKDPNSIFWKENIFSGIYKGDLCRMVESFQNEDVKANIASLLVNVFMIAIIQDQEWIGSPVNHKILKAFKKELENEGNNDSE